MYLSSMCYSPVSLSLFNYWEEAITNLPFLSAAEHHRASTDMPDFPACFTFFSHITSPHVQSSLMRYTAVNHGNLIPQSAALRPINHSLGGGQRPHYLVQGRYRKYALNQMIRYHSLMHTNGQWTIMNIFVQYMQCTETNKWMIAGWKCSLFI